MKYLLYGHGGSGNHGCEAIVRTTLALLNNDDVEVCSDCITQDEKFGVTSLASFTTYRNKNDFSNVEILLYRIIRKLFGQRDPFRIYDIINKFELRKELKNKDRICISVGGDNYCNLEPARHASRNKLFSKHNKTVLWGCSVSPELLNVPDFVEDMHRYSLITARESLTYNALVKAGITNVQLTADPAFTLDIQQTTIPDIFSTREMVGLNISPLVMEYQTGNNILLKNVYSLIDYLINNTDYGVALIPHVIIDGNNDLTPLRHIYEKYKQTSRVCLIDNDNTLNCCQIKYIISKCRFMIAARTHASIAAYSTCVPTLVIGYSVKSQGIATDLFGTADNYVIPISSIIEADDLRNAFMWIVNHEANIRELYSNKMPEYIATAYKAGDYLRSL